MSNPYGGGYQPYEPQPGPDGEPSYGADNPYAVSPAGTDGLSIASFVSSLTCCLAPVAIGLGIAGLVRTKGGRRSGRWAAVAGLVIGSLATVAMIGFFVFAVVMGSRTIFEDEARVGQCADLSSTFDDLTKADCDEPHDAEIIWVEEFDQALADEFDQSGETEFCSSRDLEPTYAQAVADSDYEVGFSTDAFDDEEPGEGDWYVCYLESSDGEDLTAPISD